MFPPPTVPRPDVVRREHRQLDQLIIGRCPGLEADPVRATSASQLLGPSCPPGKQRALLAQLARALVGFTAH